MEKMKEKNIALYECFRNLIYFPLYIVKKRLPTRELPVNIEFPKNGSPLGDEGSLKSLFIHEGDSIPLAICDPTQICTLPENLRKQTLVIGTLIEKLAIWAVACEGAQENRDGYVSRLFDRIEENKPISNLDYEGLRLGFWKDGFTTKNVADFYFSNKDKFTLIELEKFGETELISILGEDRDIASDIVLSNTPWLLQKIFSKVKYSRYQKKSKLKIVPYLLNAHFITFTGILSLEKYLEDDNNKDIIKNFISYLQKVIDDIYQEPLDIAVSIWKGKKEGEQDEIFNLENTGPNRELVKYCVWNMIQNSIYPQHLTVDWPSWRNALMLSKQIRDIHDKGNIKKNEQIFKENVANRFSYECLCELCKYNFPDL